MNIVFILIHTRITHLKKTKATACVYSNFLFYYLFIYLGKYKVTIPYAGDTAVVFNNVTVLRCLSRAD
jgi:hypothetical protein